MRVVTFGFNSHSLTDSLVPGGGVVGISEGVRGASSTAASLGGGGAALGAGVSLGGAAPG